MTTTLIYVVQLLTLVLAPLIFVVWLAAFSARSWLFFAVKSLVVASYLALIFFTGRWDIVSTWLRYVWPVLFVLAFLNGFFNCRGANPLPPMKPGRLLWLGTNVAILAIFTFLIWETRNAPRFEGGAGRAERSARVDALVCGSWRRRGDAECAQPGARAALRG